MRYASLHNHIFHKHNLDNDCVKIYNINMR